MYSVAFDDSAKKEFLKFDDKTKELIAEKIKSLQAGLFHLDKPLKGKHKGKFRKRAGDYRIVYLKEGDLLVITVIRIAHRKEVY